MSSKKSVLMICLGNSCRSPIAEAVFRNEVEKLHLNEVWEADSASLLEYHVGNPPEPRAQEILQKAGIFNYFHIARQISINDFYEFDWIFAMDSGIFYDLYQMKPNDGHAKIELIGEYDPEKEINIRDPLFDNGVAGFEKAYEQSVRSIRGFLQEHTDSGCVAISTICNPMGV